MSETDTIEHVALEADLMRGSLVAVERFPEICERFIAVSGMAPSAFGRAAAQNANFLKLLREGRVFTAEIQKRVLAFIVERGG
jgi:hypothetical protein